MDKLERELRDVLTSERRSLPGHLVELDAVHAGASRRRRRRAAATSVSVAVGLVALATVAVGLGPGVDQAFQEPAQQSPQVTPETPPAKVPAAPPWDGARPISMTATSTRTVVVLGETEAARDYSRSCSISECLRLAESHDAGRTFTPLPLPEELLGDKRMTRAPRFVRFGSGDDGWLFGDRSGLDAGARVKGVWSSHDGGHSWQHVQIPGYVVQLEAARGSVWALVGRGGYTQLWHSPVSADDWQPVPDVRVTSPADLVVDGTRVIVIGSGDSPAWSKSAGGFDKIDAPCPGATDVDPSSSGDLWVWCTFANGRRLVTSSNGRTWSEVVLDSVNAATQKGVVGARIAGEAIVSDGEGALVRASANGTTEPIQQTPKPHAPTYIGFTTPTVGYAIAPAGLWRTDDGGDTWRLLQIE